MEIEIQFANTDFIIVNKPAGLSVHNEDEAGNLLEQVKKEHKLESLFPVHRLDRETSGLIILAKNQKAASELQQMFSSRNIEKLYVGVVRGAIDRKDGIWKRPLSDRAEGRKFPQGKKIEQKACKTEWNVLETNKHITMLEFKIHTGRQHQIRKHAVLAKHQLLGDKRYGDSKYNKRLVSLYDFSRMALHSYKMVFSFRDEEFIFESKIPTAFTGLFQA